MSIALRYIAAPVLAASVAVTIAAATASATAEAQSAHTTDASTARPDHAGFYCGQFCGTYSDDPDGGAAPASYELGRSRLNPLSPVLIRLPIVDDAGALVSQH